MYVELQQNFLKGDTPRNRELATLARETGASIVATNDVHHHSPERYRLQHALVAARRNATIEQALPFIRPNHHLCLKSPEQMREIFRQYPEAVANTFRIAEQYAFNLDGDMGYCLPDASVPEGYTPSGYLRRLCLEAAQRRYGSVSRQVTGAAGRRVPPDRAPRAGRFAAPLPRDSAAGPGNHAGAGPGST